MAYQSEADDGDNDHYKAVFKQYKTPTKDLLDSLIDCSNFENLERNSKLVEEKQEPPKFPFEELQDCPTKSDFKPYSEWRVFRPLEAVEGVLIIPGILKPEARKRWFDYFYDELPSQEKSLCLKSNIDLTPVSSTKADKDDKQCDKGKQTDKQGLRWITFGFHHDWDTKHYSLNQESVIIPPRIQDLTSIVTNFMNEPFKTEAGIVNYYHRKSSLYFHTDHSEIDHSIPLYSFSLGTPTIFLIGGLSKTDNIPIVPILLGDSDLLIMGGQSRLALHAVPKIFSPAEFRLLMGDRDKGTDKRIDKQDREIDKIGDEDKRTDKEAERPKKKVKVDLGDKSTIHRINVNIRQVFPIVK